MKIRKITLVLICTAAVIIGMILFNVVYGMIKGRSMALKMMQPPVVEMAEVVEKDVFEKSESAGRLEAKYNVDVVARINGWLEKSYFKEGADVKKGQTLFLIEPNQYEIKVQEAKAAYNQAQASLINSEKELKRAVELVKKDYVSKSYYDNALATRDANRANLDVMKANLANANLNYSYTQVRSPIDGKIGKILITEGNLVNAQSGTIAKIVSNSPIYAVFNLKSQDYLRFKREERKKDFSQVLVQLKLADGSLFNEEGQIEFINNEVDETVGSIALRAIFENKDRLLVPGDFVNVIVSSKEPRKYVLVPQDAVLDSKQGFYVYTLDDEGKTVQKFIKVDKQIEDCWNVVEGLTPGEKVISNGLINMRPGIKVKVEEKIENTDKDGSK